MRKIIKLRCVSCNQEFIPPTFHEEVLLYPPPKNYRVFYYKDHFKEHKPIEVINQMWITYCPTCGYVIRFKKNIAQLKKIYSSVPNEEESRYEEVEFNKPYADYLDYLNDFMDELKKRISQKFDEISLFSFVDLFIHDKEHGSYKKDDFKFLIRFMANLEGYHDKILGKDNALTIPDKIKRLDLPIELGNGLIELNNLRNKIVHKGYEMNEEEGKQIYNHYIEFIKSLLDKKIKPLIEKVREEFGYDFLEIKDIYIEISIFLHKYFFELFTFDRTIFNNLRLHIRKLFLW